MTQTVTSLLRGLVEFILILVRRRYLIIEMAKRDIATNHVGSLLGFFWTFVNPVLIVLILWFVFSVGMKVAPKGNVPFVVWLAVGMAIWNTFSEVVGGSTGVIASNAHLVKKVVFPLSILPVVKLVSALITHAVFLAMIIVLILLYGLPVTLYWLQALYYFFAMCVLALGLSWITSSINIFVRDTGQVVNVLLQFGFWVTPIFWELGMMPVEIQDVLRLNPMFYIVQGYRDSFIYGVPFWQDWGMALYYWCTTFLVFSLGAVIFLRLRPHFADVV